ncbi:MAG TPA: tetratricopeptide repeat protein [Oculatellaceae cyanobacterium]
MFPEVSPQPMARPVSETPAGTNKAVFETPKVSPSRLELQEDFGRIIRRIMYSNSGNFQQFSQAGKTFAVENAEWTMCRNEAQLAAAQKRVEVSELLWLRALEIASSFAAGDPRLPQTLDEIASLYFARKQYDKAESFARQALEICKRAFGDFHPKVAYCANNLAGIYFCQDFYKKAEPLCRDVLTIYNKILPPDHADIGMAHGNLAMLYKKQNKHQLALTHCEQALPIRIATLGANHHMVRTLTLMRIELLELCGQTEQALQAKDEHMSAQGWKLFDANIAITKEGEAAISKKLNQLV